FKYFCKYFNVKANEDTLSKFEEVFNQFSAAEEGMHILKKEREEILDSISDKVPFIIHKYSKNKLIKNLGFDDIKINDVFYPKYSFVYISAGGNSKMSTDIEFDTDNLEEFIEYMADIIKFKKSAKSQRALMTSSLREYILERDNYTCQQCGLSIKDEPNLLLEIDHIVPVSKGGLTTEENLQTLCWKCNRSKSNKLSIPKES
ncbi:HNH endonuclease, partial [bacterium]|nr:HNH endonuclease [bacterium]